MDNTEHYIQDSCEILAVAMLQEMAESAGRAQSSDSREKFEAYDSYRLDPRRGIDEPLLSAKHLGFFNTYRGNLSTHLPGFFTKLCDLFPGESFDFQDVEREARNDGRREDFLIARSGGDPIRMSLKNYRSNAAKPQVCSGTWNSFILNFLFDGAGSVGMLRHPVTRSPFKGSDRPTRDEAIEALDLGEILPLMHQLDDLNTELRGMFLEGDDFEFYDEPRFDSARKSFGLQGIALAEQVLGAIGADRIRARVLTLAGLDAGDDVLLMDPRRCADSLTSAHFHSVRGRALSSRSTIVFESSGQTLTFWLVDETGERILPVLVPFTINSNGAWWRDGEPFEGTRTKNDKGYVVELRYGQRRPRKSRELATSVNTYLDLVKAGVFES